MTKEKQQIIIETDITGKKLHKVTLSNVDISVKALDSLVNRAKQLNALKKLLKQSDKREIGVISSLQDLISISSLLHISRMDLGIIVNNLYLNKEAPSSLFFIKQGYLVLNESLKAYNKKGNKINSLVQAAGDRYIKPYNECLTLLREFRKGGKEKEIGEVRNKIAGHIDEDFLVWHETISTLDAEKLARIIIQFMEFTNMLMALCLNLLNHFEEIEKLQAEASSKRLENMLNKIDELTATHNETHPNNQLILDTGLFRNLLKR